MLDLTRMRSPRHRAHRVGVVLSLLFLVSQAAGLIHFIAVPHSTCQEHGELVHEPSAQQTHDHAPLLRARFAAEAPEELEQHEHDHCVLSMHGRDRSTLSARQPVPGAPHQALRPVVALTDRAAQPSVALYLLAPKASPPVC